MESSVWNIFWIIVELYVRGEFSNESLKVW